MLIHAPTVDRREDEVVVSARVESGRAGLPEILWFAVPTVHAAHVSDRADPFFALLLPVAMRLGEDLEVRGPISPRLVHGAREYIVAQRVIHPEHFKRAITLVPARLARLAEPEVRGVGVATTFTGGVDSSYMIWKHGAERESLPPSRVTHALMINGFDYDVDLDDDGYFRALDALYRPFLARNGVELVTLRTNQRAFRQPVLGEAGLVASYGAALTACALSLGGLFGRLYLASWGEFRMDYERSGAHPLIDHLLSSEVLEVFHAGQDRSRFERSEVLADWPETWSLLRVCRSGRRSLDEHGRVANCGRCEKCLRTMMTLAVLGALDRFTTFAEPLTREVLRGTKQNRDTMVFTREIIREAERRGKTELAADLRYANARGWVREHATDVRRGLGKILRGVRAPRRGPP